MSLGNICQAQTPYKGYSSRGSIDHASTITNSLSFHTSFFSFTYTNQIKRSHKGQDTNIEKIFVIRTFGIMSHHVAYSCRCRCKHVTHARILTPNLDLFSFSLPFLGYENKVGVITVHWLPVFPLSLLTLLLSPAPCFSWKQPEHVEIEGPCAVHRPHRRKLYPSCRQIPIMSHHILFGYLFTLHSLCIRQTQNGLLLWDSAGYQVQLEFGIAYARV